MPAYALIPLLLAADPLGDQVAAYRRGLSSAKSEEALCRSAQAAAALVADAATREGALPASPPGIRVGSSIPDGAPYWFVDYGKLAAISTGLKTAKLFAAAAPLLEHSDAALPPFWLEQESSLTACVRPDRLPEKLDALRSAWVAAPPCATALLEPRLTAVLGELSAKRCFCKGTEGAVKRTVAALERLPLASVKTAAAGLALKARYGCLEDTMDYGRSGP